MPKLTAKQEAFAQAVASGMTQADAYRSAYSAKNMKNETIHVKASELMANGMVGGRVAELRAEVAEKELWSRIDSVETLKTIVHRSESDTNIIAAVKVLNDMHGFNAPIKTELTGKDGAPIQVETVDLSGLTAAELKTMRGLLEKASAATNA